MLKKRLLLISVVFGFLIALFTGNSGIALPAKPPISLKPTAAQDEACKYISQYLLRNHYRKVAVNDSLSQQIFNRYLDNLDGSKSYFLAGDIETLKKSYGNHLDDEFQAGQANAGFAIYNLFLKRATAKMQFMKAAVDTMHFDFSKQDTLALTRKTGSWPADRNQLTDLWKKELKYQWLNLKYSGENNISVRKALSKSFTSRLNLLAHQKPEDAFQAYTSAVTTSFDPHTNYFSPDEYDNFQIDMSRSLEGIGAKLQTESEYTVVNEVIPGGPAFRSNLLKKGDKIIGVGQGKKSEIVDVTSWRINDVVKLIRGKKGTIVRLKILSSSQGGHGPSKIIQLLRDKVDLVEQAAKKSIIQQDGKKIGVITLPSFYLDFEGEKNNTTNYASTSNDVARILNELKHEKIDGLVIDLRNNGGGSLEEAVKVTGLFIPKGPVVQISNATDGNTVLNNEEKEQQYLGPLTVLVNRYSASASEIFAAAIQDYGRGVIIGERTFGKGTVQSIIKIVRPITFYEKSPELGEIKLTVAKFYRISGGSTQHKGVEPDITVPSMIDASTIGEDTYTSSLPWTTIAQAAYQQTKNVTPQTISLLRQKEEERSSGNPVYQNYLQALHSLDTIRKKKAVSLQELSFKSEIETIKKIEKDWIQEEDANKNTGKDVLLHEATEVTADLSTLTAK